MGSHSFGLAKQPICPKASNFPKHKPPKLPRFNDPTEDEIPFCDENKSPNLDVSVPSETGEHCPDGFNKLLIPFTGGIVSYDSE